MTIEEILKAYYGKDKKVEEFETAAVSAAVIRYITESASIRPLTDAYLRSDNNNVTLQNLETAIKTNFKFEGCMTKTTENELNAKLSTLENKIRQKGFDVIKKEKDGAPSNFANLKSFGAYGASLQNNNNPQLTTYEARGYCEDLGSVLKPFIKDWGRGFNEGNRIFVTCNSVNRKIEGLIQYLGEDVKDLSTLTPMQQLNWTDILNFGDYFQGEMENYKKRRDYTDKMRTSFLEETKTNKNAKETKLYRYISEGEKNDISSKGVIRQSVQDKGGEKDKGKPKTSYERQKWFTTDKDKVGTNVLHDYLMEIELKPGAFKALTGAESAKEHKDMPADKRPAWVTNSNDINIAKKIVVVKDNEAESFGIHEDALGLFNEFIKQVVIEPRVKDSKKSGSQTTTQKMESQEAINLPKGPT